LIWVENGLHTALFLGCQHPFYPITTRQWNRPNQKQTNPNRKMNNSLPLIKVENGLFGTQKPINFYPTHSLTLGFLLINCAAHFKKFLRLI